MRGRPVPLLEKVPLIVLAVMAAAAAEPQDSEDDAELRAARGRTSYRIYCQNCHGKTGEGDGPIADLLKKKPTDLTVMSRDNDGEFPAERLHETIDGRHEVGAHGSREMPIWGLSFQDPGRAENQDDEIRERILDLVAYVESIQASGE